MDKQQLSALVSLVDENLLLGEILLIGSELKIAENSLCGMLLSSSICLTPSLPPSLTTSLPPSQPQPVRFSNHMQRQFAAPRRGQQ